MGKRRIKVKLYLFDLDGTLLKSNKTISEETIKQVNVVRGKGNLIGISTSRSEQNSKAFLGDLKPDILVASGGALVKKYDDYIFKAVFNVERTRELIRTVRTICGDDVEITIDTVDKHYWNYKINPKKQNADTWGDSIWTDFQEFDKECLKMCVEIFDEKTAEGLKRKLTDCDVARFSDGFWYKFTRKGVTKEDSIRIVCDACGITTDDIIAFGDDYPDIGMLKMAGIGVAMGNAISRVKEIADIVIGNNDEDGIAAYLKE